MAHDPTSYVLMKTLFWKELKAEQPLSYICHDKLAPIAAHFPVCICTVPQKPDDVFMLHSHQATNFLVVFSFVDIKLVVKLLDSNCFTISENSLQSKPLNIVLRTEHIYFFDINLG